MLLLRNVSSAFFYCHKRISLPVLACLNERKTNKGNMKGQENLSFFLPIENKKFAEGPCFS